MSILYLELSEHFFRYSIRFAKPSKSSSALPVWEWPGLLALVAEPTASLPHFRTLRKGGHAGSGGDDETNLPWNAVLRFIPRITDVRECGKKLEFLASIWCSSLQRNSVQEDCMLGARQAQCFGYVRCEADSDDPGWSLGTDRP